jgi:hypothetical protein
MTATPPLQAEVAELKKEAAGRAEPARAGHPVAPGGEVIDASPCILGFSDTGAPTLKMTSTPGASIRLGARWPSAAATAEDGAVVLSC